MVLAGIECSQKSLIFANGIPVQESVDFSTLSNLRRGCGGDFLSLTASATAAKTYYINHAKHEPNITPATNINSAARIAVIMRIHLKSPHADSGLFSSIHIIFHILIILDRSIYYMRKTDIRYFINSYIAR